MHQKKLAEDAIVCFQMLYALLALDKYICQRNYG